MLITSARQCALNRLHSERKYGCELLTRARSDPTPCGKLNFDAECRDWGESLAFAINFAFNGHATPFLETLGHRDDGVGLGWKPQWANPDDQIHDLSLHLSLLDKWLDKLTEQFTTEEYEYLICLGHLVKHGGTSTRRAMQLACQLEAPTLKWILDAFTHDKLVRTYCDGSEIEITPRGITYHDILQGRDPEMTFPPEIQQSISKLRKDYPDPTKTAFIIMRFGGTKAHERILKAVRETLIKYGLTGLRADDKEYHDDLYYNIMTYMYGCGFGVAIYERLESDEFNPNVSLEVGGMLTMSKPVCLLKDKTLKTLNTDLAGKMYRQFDPQDPEATIGAVLRSWLQDKHIV